jgi:uncharacterized membrane protein (DUF4010 family)
MNAYEPFASLAVALAAGLLVGFEREQSSDEEGGDRATFLGGARTYPLFALFGATAALLSRQLGSAPLLLALGGTLGFLLVSYADDVRNGRGHGLTTEGAFLLTFCLGALAASQGVLEPLRERALVVGSLAVVATLLLSVKPALHGLVHRASRQDVFATLKFLLVAVVALPLLPDQAMGPLGALNPFHLGLMVVFIAGIGFAGYLAIRLLGAGRGMLLTGLIGGLVSSTAVTLTFSGRAKEEPRLGPSCARAVTLASAIMFGRVVLVVAVLDFDLARRIALPLGAAFVVGLLISWLMVRRTKSVELSSTEVTFANPFELSQALKFGLLFAGVLLASKAAVTFLGDAGTYATGVVAGSTDVDAIALSMARLAKAGLPVNVAATTILLGVASNTIVKAVMAVVVGGGGFGRQIAPAFAAMLAVGALGLGALWMG